MVPLTSSSVHPEVRVVLAQASVLPLPQFGEDLERLSDSVVI
jgi:hypothetical protein